MGFASFGINIEEDAGFIRCKCDKIVGANIDLDFPSVGATENIILASIFAEGKTVINNAAREPEIIDLQNFLNKMGAKVVGAGSSTIEITGVKELKEVSYKIMPDRIEAGTLLCAAAITGGSIRLQDAVPEHIIPVINKLEEAGCKIESRKRLHIFRCTKQVKSSRYKNNAIPRFSNRYAINICRNANNS